MMRRTPLLIGIGILVLAGAFGLFASGLLEVGPVGGLIVARRAEQQRHTLFTVAREGNLQDLYQALAVGADVTSRNEEGQTLIAYTAATSPDPLAVSAIVAAGADLNTRSDEGLTPLMLAARDNPAPEVFLALLNAGADPTLRTDDGKSIADFADDNPALRRSAFYSRVRDLVGGGYVDAYWPSLYQSPVAGATFASRAAHLPNAPRRYRNGVHEGFDFYNGVVSVPISYGTPVLAVGDGVVVRADHNYAELSPEAFQNILGDAARQSITPEQSLDDLRGRQVWLEHPGGFVSRYAHLSAIPAELKVGDRVSPGETVGFIGNSGTQAGAEATEDGPHLHFEFWRDQQFMGQGLSPEGVYALVRQVFGSQVVPQRWVD